MADAASSGGLVRPRGKSFSFVSGGKPKKIAKQADQEEDEDMDAEETSNKNQYRDDLLIQLETRVRALEHAAFSTALINRKSVAVEAMNNSFQDYLKAVKENPDKQLAGPASQALFALLTAIEVFDHKDTSPRMMKVLHACKRLSIMMEKSGPDLMCSWVKELVALPTFDRPGVEPKSRLTFALKGSLLLPREDAPAANVLTELQEKRSAVVARQQRNTSCR